MIDKCWLQITSGQGPEECALAVKYIFKILTDEAKKYNLQIKTLEKIIGDKTGTYISILIELKGKNLQYFTNSWEGTVQWICNSPYRPNHKRKNWFVGIDIFKIIEEHSLPIKKEIKFYTMRASGPGGQHVNTTDSAVRVKHLPTGTTATASEERSQYMNKKLALARLILLLKKEHHMKKADKINEKWKKHNQLERGNPIRVFVGKEFKQKL